MQESYGADLAPKFDNSQLIGYHLYIQKVWVCVCTPTLKPWVILPPQINWLSTVQYPTYHVRHGLLGSNRGRHRPTAEPSSWASSLRTITKQIYKEQSLSRRKSVEKETKSSCGSRLPRWVSYLTKICVLVLLVELCIDPTWTNTAPEHVLM